MSFWDFSIVVMGIAIIACSLYAAGRLKATGCLFVAGAWAFAVVATLYHPHKVAPFCDDKVQLP